jgi:hypothetical protein
MPFTTIKFKQVCTEHWVAEADIPQDIIDDGDEAVISFLQGNLHLIENRELESTDIDETEIDMQIC